MARHPEPAHSACTLCAKIQSVSCSQEEGCCRRISSAAAPAAHSHQTSGDHHNRKHALTGMVYGLQSPQLKMKSLDNSMRAELHAVHSALL